MKPDLLNERHEWELCLDTFFRNNSDAEILLQLPLLIRTHGTYAACVYLNAKNPALAGAFTKHLRTFFPGAVGPENCIDTRALVAWQNRNLILLGEKLLWMIDVAKWLYRYSALPEIPENAVVHDATD